MNSLTTKESCHKEKFLTIQRLYRKQRAKKGNLKTVFEGSQWDDDLYDRTMSDEKLVHVVLSGSEDEECQEEC